MLAVTGRIVNRADHELAVPLVRVALFDGDRHELYHWTFVPGVATLDPGRTPNSARGCRARRATRIPSKSPSPGPVSERTRRPFSSR